MDFDDDRKDIIKKVVSGILVVLIAVGIYFFLHAPPAGLSSRPLSDYKTWNWVKYETPYYTLYHPAEYVVTPGLKATLFKMPNGHESFSIGYYPRSFVKGDFDLLGSVPKIRYTSGFLNDCKIWFYEQVNPTGGAVYAVMQKDRKSVSFKGVIQNPAFSPKTPSVETQKTILRNIIESIRLKRMR